MDIKKIEFKKKLSKFLLSEKGSVSKQSVIRIGVIAAAASILSTNAAAGHANHHISYTDSDGYQGSSQVCQNEYYRRTDEITQAEAGCADYSPYYTGEAGDSCYWENDHISDHKSGSDDHISDHSSGSRHLSFGPDDSSPKDKAHMNEIRIIDGGTKAQAEHLHDICTFGLEYDRHYSGDDHMSNHVSGHFTTSWGDHFSNHFSG